MVGPASEADALLSRPSYASSLIRSGRGILGEQERIVRVLVERVAVTDTDLR